MHQTSYDVIVCGSLHLDIMVHAPDLPQPDETVVGSRWGMVCGGKGGNQAVMAAHAGARVGMIGRVGGDDFGARLIANLATAGVDSSAIARGFERSGMSVAIVRSDGEYGAVIVSEANLRIDPQAAAAAWVGLGGAPVLALQNEVPEAVNIAIARAARVSGARVLLNAAPARAISRDLLALVDTLIVNRVEAAMMAGASVADPASATRASMQLGGSLRDVVVTLGAGGLVVQPRGEAPRFIAARQVAAVSTHGAGDCFVGALAAVIARGCELVDACHTAKDAAADFVSRPRAD